MAISEESQWHITGSVGEVDVDIYLDVPDAYEWPRPEPSEKTIDPCDGTATLTYFNDGTMPKRVGAPEFRIDGEDPEADDVWAALQTVYMLRGPFTLTTPTEEFDAVVDPTVSGWSDRNYGAYRLVGFGWQEV